MDHSLNIDTIKIQSKIFKGLSNPIRLAILNILYERDMSVSDIVNIIGRERTLVSKHLKVLKNLGIIEAKSIKQKRFYSLRLRCLMDSVFCSINIINQK